MKKRFRFYFFDLDIMTCVMMLTVFLVGFVVGIIGCVIIRPYDENKKVINVTISNRCDFKKNLFYRRIYDLARMTDTLNEAEMKKYFKEFGLFAFLNGGPENVLEGKELKKWQSNPNNITVEDTIDPNDYSWGKSITSNPFWKYIVIDKERKEVLLYLRDYDKTDYYILKGGRVYDVKQIELDIKIDTLIFKNRKKTTVGL